MAKVERYKPKNEILKKYLENNEPKYADVGNPTLISIEDIDIIIDRILKSNSSDVIKIGKYQVSKHPPIPRTNQVDVIWLASESGEGMSVDLDKLWKNF